MSVQRNHDDDPVRRIGLALAELVPSLDADVGHRLDDAVLRACRVLTRCDLIALWFDDQAPLIAGADALAHAIEVAVAAADGPPRQARRIGSSVEIDDTTADVRWPTMSKALREIGIRSALSVPLATDREAEGSLTLLSNEPGALAGAAVMVAAIAPMIVACDAQRRMVAAMSDRIANLERALDTRPVIEQAKGIMMATQHIDPDAAFLLLREASNRTGQAVREVAADLVERTVAGD